MGAIVRILLALCATAALTQAAPASDDTSTNSSKRCFPDTFLFGSATAAYQVEGGWNETGRTPSIWDDFCREKKGFACANVADDFLHRYRDDIALMVDSKLDSFRFSISWSRAMTWDDATKQMKPNAPGIAFYHALIDELRRNNIVPIVTLYHWDLPLVLHRELEPQGWISKDIIDHFLQYAELMFTEFGGKIGFWSTFNEPWTFVTQGYGNGNAAPGLKHSKTNAYTVAHHVLIAHGKSVRRFRELKAQNVIHENARIGVVLNADFSYPLDPTNPEDVAAGERKMQFGLGWFLAPLVSGRYPAIMRQRAGDNLPEFTEEDAAVVKGSYDLFMLNHYSSKIVTDCKSEHSKVKCHKQAPGWERDLGIDETRSPKGARLSSKNENGQYNCNWFTGYAPGYLETIKWMHAQDPKTDILLTENGWCGNETIENMDQLWYYQTYLGEVHKGITELNIPIIGYTAWSFVDNYEWGSFKPRFGLHYVNFTSQTGSKGGYIPQPTDLARIPRIAARWYKKVAETKCLDGFEIDVNPEYARQDAAVELRERNRTHMHSHKSKLTASLLVCLAFAAPAIVWFSRRRRPLRRSSSRSVHEATPLMHKE
ncbi:Glycoside hydrolase, partial [Globisporangium splendens]